MSSSYLQSVICKNGHRISYSLKLGESYEPYCPKCGAPTTNKCDECEAVIKGRYISSGFVDLTPYTKPIPLYCPNCSKEYPWTSKILEDSSRILDMDDHLNEEDKNKLKEDIPNLVKDTPDAKISAYSFKEKMGKAKPGTIEMFKDIFTNIVSEVLFKIMFS